MTDIGLVKTPKGLAGWDAEEEIAWKKFRGWVNGLEPGECIRISYAKPRNPAFHRKFFALLKVGFDAWEPRRKKHRGQIVQKNFERFRKDVTIAAGFYEIVATTTGGVRYEAKSIAFSNMTEEEFEKVYSAVADVLLQGVLVRYNRAELDRVVAEILEFTK